MIKRILIKILSKLQQPAVSRIIALDNKLEGIQIIQARGIVHGWGNQRFAQIRDSEFKIFSQWGEDGIIQYLLTHVPIENKIFVEFGVEDYCESNTRLLLLKDDWRGLVLDGNSKYIKSIKKRDWAWRHHLDAVNAFITVENINSLISGSGLSGDIGLLSIDVDGNDYWLWKALTVVQPRIVVVEYNGLLGARLPVATPYDPSFVRNEKHFSNLYYGASLSALCMLAAKKGYVFVGSNSTGSNAFFVRKDCACNLEEASIADEYSFRRFRESRDAKGKLSFLSHFEQINAIRNMHLVDISSGVECAVSEIADELL